MMKRPGAMRSWTEFPRRLFVWAVAGLLLAGSAEGAVLRVGPGRAFSRPSEAARVAQAGDVVEIDAGTYTDVCTWRADRLTIRAAGGAPVMIRAGERLSEGKGIWVVKGSDVVVSGIAFTGAACPDRNGAGIRLEGRACTVSKCRFTDNENGILCGAIPGWEGSAT